MLEILNKTKIKIDEKFLAGAERVCLETIGAELGSRQKISVAFVNSGEMKKLNKKYTGRDGITDVLSFNFDSDDYLGEIIICPSKDSLSLPRVFLPAEKKRELGGKRKNKRILTRLLIHGILHLEGYDHEKSAAGEKKMLAMENKVLEKLESGF